MSRPDRFLFGCVCLAGAAVSAVAQVPDEFTNLKVLPGDIGKRALMETMRDFASALGVRCNHCHVGESEASLEGYDFASDDPEPKRVARAMMRMTNEINAKLLPATGRRSPVRVRCETCHRGVQEPVGLDELLTTIAVKRDAAASVARYRALREEYYGRAAYDFGPLTLLTVASHLGQEHQDIDGARALVELNLEFHPDHAGTHAVLGQIHLQQGDRERAIASLERAIALDPANVAFVRTLERLRAAE